MDTESELLTGGLMLLTVRDLWKSYPGQPPERAVLRGAALSLADEPTGNLDETASEAVLALMLQLASETGTAVLLATHSAAIAARLGRRVHLSGGQLA